MENAQLKGWQLFAMVYCFVVGTTCILLPGRMIAETKQYAWLFEFGALVIGLILACGWLYLSKCHEGLSIVQISVKLFGKWIGGGISLLYILFFIQIASWVTRNMSDFMHVNLMPRTPISVVNILVLVICAYAVVRGIGAISSVSWILAPILSLMFWIPYSIMLREWDWSRFHLDNPIQLWPAIISSRHLIAFPFMETISFMMLLPLTERKSRKLVLLGIGIAGFLTSLCVVFTIGILGVYRSSHLVNPIIIIFSEMRFSSAIEHMEALISVVFLLMVFLKLSILFYCAVLAICQLFNLKNRAAVAFPLIWIISAYSLYFDNVIENMEWIHKYLFDYYAIYAILLPALLMAMTWAKRWVSVKTG
ncbi:endospore germination permease [Paenibacillus sp. BC26]|uniref:GerAB/ArcD/ProY family transporter n=1 Tax=Paenibacillus sp. BC26 TaxID=1881032 RepID=UPI0008EFCBBF|nr:endospore germination permease [Paenibacillus sp. BC26]SFS65192.1 spore germination protein (amino acid permease) [Paenibacillus sp. BC26]